MNKKLWTVYIIRTELGTLYTGITTNLERRLADHKASKRGAKFFHFSDPKKVVFQEHHPNRSSATKREIEIKKMTRSGKEALIQDSSSDIT